MKIASSCKQGRTSAAIFSSGASSFHAKDPNLTFDLKTKYNKMPFIIVFNIKWNAEKYEI